MSALRTVTSLSTPDIDLIPQPLLPMVWFTTTFIASAPFIISIDKEGVVNPSSHRQPLPDSIFLPLTCLSGRF